MGPRCSPSAIYLRRRRFAYLRLMKQGFNFLPPEINITLLEQMGGGRMGSMKTRRDNGAGSAAEWPEVIKLRNFHTAPRFYFILFIYIFRVEEGEKLGSNGALEDWTARLLCVTRFASRQVQSLRPKMRKSDRPPTPTSKVAAVSHRHFRRTPSLSASERSIINTLGGGRFHFLLLLAYCTDHAARGAISYELECQLSTFLMTTLDTMGRD